MEDSYTVHRRRKAAARRRDKTPEASRAIGINKDVGNDDDDEENKEKIRARIRMEQMVEDTERMEVIANDDRRRSPCPPSSTPNRNNNEDNKSHQVQDKMVAEKCQINVETSVGYKNKDTTMLILEQAECIDDNVDVKELTNENRTEMTSKIIKISGGGGSAKRETSRQRGKQKRLEPQLNNGSSDSNFADDDDKSEISDADERRKGKKYKRGRRDKDYLQMKNEQPQKQENKKLTQIGASNLTLNKQIIPLSDDCLMMDYMKAQREYDKREIGILDADLDDQINPRMEASLRNRKKGRVEKRENEINNEAKEDGRLSRFLSWFSSFMSKKKVDIVEKETLKETEKVIKTSETKFVNYFRFLSDIRVEFKAFVDENPHEIYRLRVSRNKCINQLLLIIIYCGLGAFMFRFTEGAFETFYKCGVKRVKRDFLDSLWDYSHNLREDDWKSMARRKLMEFEEQLHAAHEAGVHSYSGQKSWTFLNAVVYCLTVITTIGYGHISPSTTTGRAATIIYAIFGIPLFLIILADFGKLFTRGIKFLWAFVRRVYYTGSCRRVRRTAPVQEVMKGVQLVYDFATFRRPSQMNPEDLEEIKRQQTQTVLNLDANIPPSQPDTPGTPALSNFVIDDEFNLPISVAITILIAYIFVGATVYNIWEPWGFFESFYFVFISMSTIGFGDYVPKHPIYMMCSIVYLVFGLALTSMCINVVQVMLSDSFKHATQKIGATIGFDVPEYDGSIEPAPLPPVELAEVHATIIEEDEDLHKEIAPYAKAEDVEL
ncbi:hypothetical protein PV328_003674 [Microctonus aethiopoides]|uniref:Potassium channel domain-containing protein n=1 Tax=Microctonus aethiopoides TaxID=144406 RepID=A0AA39F8X0_9HYME|nr:hypothetical protein PV328_003674 [Microctonus aethiopoides]